MTAPLKGQACGACSGQEFSRPEITASAPLHSCPRPELATPGDCSLLPWEHGLECPAPQPAGHPQRGGPGSAEGWLQEAPSHGGTGVSAPGAPLLGPHSPLHPGLPLLCLPSAGPPAAESLMLLHTWTVTPQSDSLCKTQLTPGKPGDRGGNTLKCGHISLHTQYLVTPTAGTRAALQQAPTLCPHPTLAVLCKPSFPMSVARQPGTY